MARNRRRKSLYEIIGRGGSDYGHSRGLEHSEPEKSDGSELQTEGSMPAATPAETGYRWPAKPRIIQFNANRIEFSLPYQLAIALALGIILLILVVFRLGQNISTSQAAGDDIKMIETVSKKNQSAVTAGPQRGSEKKEIWKIPVSAKKTAPVISTGNNRIVIQTCSRRADLEPAKKFFVENGIETEIRRIDNVYYLLSVQKYRNPNRSGTDGYYAKKKIIELGANYKAPAGYGNFGNKPFHDAYGMKFND